MGDVSAKGLDLLFTQGPLVVLLLVIIIAGAKRKWVFGWVYEDEQRRSEQWRTLALELKPLLRTSVELLETTAAKNKRS